MTNPIPAPNPRRDAAIQLLYDNLAELPHERYGTINLLPFAHDSDQVRMIKRQACEAMIGLLDAHGYLNTDTAVDVPRHSMAVQCVDCGTELISVGVDADGVAKLKAEKFFQATSQINPDCASGHAALTPDDMRQYMEREFYSDPATRLATECHICGAAPNRMCKRVKGLQIHQGMHDERGRPQ